MRRAWSLGLALIAVVVPRASLGAAAPGDQPSAAGYEARSGTDTDIRRAQAAQPPSPTPPATGRPSRSPAPGAAAPPRTPTAPSPRTPTGPAAVTPTAPTGATAISGPVAISPTLPAQPSFAGLTNVERFSRGGIPLMLGDMAPMFGGPRMAAAAAGNPSAVAVPWAKGYKMADNQSPRPQDRVFVAFNFFDNLTQPDGSTLRSVKVYREFFGLEKTFCDQNISLGVRLPLNTISANGAGGGTNTALGDLTIFAKGILWENRETGSLLSSGLAVTTPNGPTNFAGAPFAKSFRSTALQPFIGYIGNLDRWFIQGFSGINVPTNDKLVTMYYNDIGFGYFLYRAPDTDAFVTAIVPTFEVHVNTPLNHRATSAFVGGPIGIPDVVDLTFGVSVGLGNNAILSAGIVNPVTGPRPFDLEALVLLNIFFGQPRRPPTPPPVL